MADQKISDLTSSTPQDTDSIPAARSGSNVRYLWSAVKTALQTLFDTRYATTAQGVKADGALQAASNLSDIASATTARTNLGLGTAATTASTAYATAAQGTKADGALQAANNLSDIGLAATARTNLGLGTAATQASTAFATAAQGGKADTAVQDVGTATAALTAKTTPVDADTLPISDSAASGVGKKLTWANLKATAKTYFDTLYALTGAIGSSGQTMTTARLLGRSTAGTGAIEEITLGTNLSFSGTTLNAAGGGGSPGGSSGQLQWNNAGAFGGSNFWQGTNLVELYNSTNAQVLRVFNTRTDGSNGEWFGAEWSTNICKVGTFKNGTGANRSLELYVGNTRIITSDSTFLQIDRDLYVNADFRPLQNILAGAKYQEWSVMTAPAAPAANKGRVYFELSGGKVRLMAVFPTGAAQQIAIEP